VTMQGWKAATPCMATLGPVLAWGSPCGSVVVGASLDAD
jgi:hypothetical protein